MEPPGGSGARITRFLALAGNALARSAGRGAIPFRRDVACVGRQGNAWTMAMHGHAMRLRCGVNLNARCRRKFGGEPAGRPRIVRGCASVQGRERQDLLLALPTVRRRVLFAHWKRPHGGRCSCRKEATRFW